MPSAAYDAALKNRHYDADGRLHILRSRISKATVNPYYGREIPGSETLGLEPSRIYYLLRDPTELKKAADSFARVPLMFKHIAVSADDPHQESIAGAIGSDVSFESPYLVADLSVWDAEAIAGIETDTVRELSCSYHYTADMTPGVFNQTPYDGVMRNISGNHVALVEAGRAGPDVMAADSGLETHMKETKFGKLIYAILCAASPKLAADEALKPLVLELTPETLDAATLEPQLVAMDSALPIAAAMDAMAKAKDAQEDDEDDDPDAKEAKDCAMCEGKDGKHSKDCKYAKDKKAAKDRAAKDAKEEEERKEKEAKDKKAKDKKAMDEEMKVAMDAFKIELRATEDARRAVRDVVGDVIAQDSAAEIYGFALDQMKVDRKGVEGVPALRALFNLAVSASKEKAPLRPAFDAAGDMKERFPNAAREIRLM